MNRYERFGWIMFALSGVFFLAIGFREDDPLTIGGAVVWMLGCASFLFNPDKTSHGQT